MDSQRTDALEGVEVKPLDAGFLWRIFHVLLVLAALSGAISLGGKWIGHTIAAGGHTDSTKPFEIVIGNNVLSVPANAIRFEKARHDGDAARLDLYLHWPGLTGYTDTARDAFNNAEDRHSILFLSFEKRTMTRAMSGRFEPIYRRLVEGRGKPGPAGIRFHDFRKTSGYTDEVLAVAARAGATPFVARCLSGPAARQSLAPCERDIHLGDAMTLTYRFPEELLGAWKTLDAAIAKKANAYLLTNDVR